MSDEDEQVTPAEFNQIMTQSVSHEVHGWIEGLDESALVNLQMIINATTNYPLWGAQMIGIIQGEKRRRFGSCVVCSVNHEQEHEDLVKSTPMPGTPIPGSPFKVGDADAFGKQVENLLGMPYPEFLQECAKFSVMPQGDQGDPVFCRNCNMRYITLEDRMLKAPDDCGGCHQATKTGQKFPPPDQQ